MQNDFYFKFSQWGLLGFFTLLSRQANEKKKKTTNLEGLSFLITYHQPPRNKRLQQIICKKPKDNMYTCRSICKFILHLIVVQKGVFKFFFVIGNIVLFPLPFPISAYSCLSLLILSQPHLSLFLFVYLYAACHCLCLFLSLSLTHTLSLISTLSVCLRLSLNTNMHKL